MRKQRRIVTDASVPRGGVVPASLAWVSAVVTHQLRGAVCVPRGPEAVHRLPRSRDTGAAYALSSREPGHAGAPRGAGTLRHTAASASQVPGAQQVSIGPVG